VLAVPVPLNYGAGVLNVLRSFLSGTDCCRFDNRCITVPGDIHASTCDVPMFRWLRS